MCYVCPECDTVYHSDVEDGCQGSRDCSRGPRQSLTWYPNVTVSRAELMLKHNTLREYA